MLTNIKNVFEEKIENTRRREVSVENLGSVRGSKSAARLRSARMRNVDGTAEDLQDVG